MAIEAFAPAKINLTLHVTGQRPNGYHLLDSLVVFADIGDTIRAEPADDLSLTITGPESAALEAEPDNLVLRAARLQDPQGTAKITLTKRLPVASGIGGGSADAAAALHALSKLWNQPLPSPEAILSLGADVPVCLNKLSQRMQGIGEQVSPTPELPAFDIVLINPRVPVSTPAVFKSLTSRTNPPMPAKIPHCADTHSAAEWLRSQRNDLQPAAIAQAPAIQDVLTYLDKSGSLLSRMSGSGATCFGLFAPGTMPDLNPPSNWWVASGKTL